MFIVDKLRNFEHVRSRPPPHCFKAKSDERESSSNIERILGVMDSNGIKPNMRSFTIYIDSFAQKHDFDSVNESNNILSRLVDMYLAGELDFEPDVACWTTVIRGWMRLAKKRRIAAAKAEEVMERMIVLHDDGKISVQADAVVYFSVLNAWVYAGSMADAERILDTMDYLWKQGDEEMKPMLRTYKTIIDGWVKSPEEGAMERAENLQKKVIVRCEEDGEDEVLPDVYKSLVFGYSKNDNPFKAEEYLRLMIEKNYEPDSFCFDKVIESYTALGDPDIIKNAYGVFELMESCQKRGIMKPPNERVYTSIIRAIAKEGKPGMAKKAQTIVRRMQQLYERGNNSVLPTVFTYNAVLKACAHSVPLDENERRTAFNTAIGAFNVLRSSDDLIPDHVTYSALIKCSHLLPEGEQRDNLIKATFNQCVNNDKMNDFFVRDLEDYGSDELSRQLLSQIGRL